MFCHDLTSGEIHFITIKQLKKELAIIVQNIIFSNNIFHIDRKGAEIFQETISLILSWGMATIHSFWHHLIGLVSRKFNYFRTYAVETQNQAQSTLWLDISFRQLKV